MMPGNNDQTLHMTRAETDLGVDFVKVAVSKVSSVKKVILFGSRANGTCSSKSDFDFAFEWVQSGQDSWGEFCGRLREDFPLLNSLDLVRLDQVSESFRTRITSKGVIIYE